jgi:hypothetical protein
LQTRRNEIGIVKAGGFETLPYRRYRSGKGIFTTTRRCCRLPDASGISAGLEIEITFVNVNLQTRCNERGIVKAGGFETLPYRRYIGAGKGFLLLREGVAGYQMLRVFRQLNK